MMQKVNKLLRHDISLLDGDFNGHATTLTGLSGGQVTGIVFAILIIVALVAGGAVAGVLVWKYQPWHNILNKKSTADGESIVLLENACISTQNLVYTML